MREIRVTTGTAFDKTLVKVTEPIILIVDLSRPLKKLIGHNLVQFRLVNKTEIKLVVDAVIESMGGSSTVQRMGGSSTVQRMGGSSTVQRMGDSSTVQSMWGSSTVQSMGDSSTVQRMGGSSTVQSMGDSSTVQSMGDSSTVQSMGDSSTVQRMWGSSTVQSMGDSSTVQRMWGSSKVNLAFGNALVRLISSSASAKLLHAALAILHDCNPTVDARPDQIIKTAQFIHNTQTFLEAFSDDDDLILYKSVKDDNTDFYTGRIKYEGVVDCPDWDPSPDRQCGGGLHLSPTPEQALAYNRGKVLRCRVHPDDFVVYGPDISKVRCRRVVVLDE